MSIVGSDGKIPGAPWGTYPGETGPDPRRRRRDPVVEATGDPPTPDLPTPMDEIIQRLKVMADEAYCQHSDLSRQDGCLGEDVKLLKGTFGSRELACHRRASVHLGRHQAFCDAIKLLRESKADGPAE